MLYMLASDTLIKLIENYRSTFNEHQIFRILGFDQKCPCKPFKFQDKLCQLAKMKLNENVHNYGSGWDESYALWSNRAVPYTYTLYRMTQYLSSVHLDINFCVHGCTLKCLSLR